MIGVLQVQAGELVQDGPVEVPGHDRGQRRVAGGGSRLRPGQVHRSGYLRGGGAGGAPARLQPGGAGLAAQPGQVHVHGQLGRLAVVAGQHPRIDQPPAGLLQRIMLTLEEAAGIFRPAAGPQRGQHRGHRGGGRAGQVPRKPPGPADRGFQPHRPVTKPVPAGIGGAAGPLDHLLRQRPQIRQPRPAASGGQQDRVRVRAALFGQPIGPLADHLRPRAAQLPGRQRGGDQRMRGQPPGPLHRRTGGPGGDVGDGPQPRRRPVLPIGVMPLLGAERGQQPGPRRGVLRPGLLQPDQRLRLHRRPQLSRITGGQVAQPGPHHGQRLRHARRRGRLSLGAHGPDHLPGDGWRVGPGTPGLRAARAPRAYERPGHPGPLIRFLVRP